MTSNLESWRRAAYNAEECLVGCLASPEIAKHLDQSIVGTIIKKLHEARVGMLRAEAEATQTAAGEPVARMLLPGPRYKSVPPERAQARTYDEYPTTSVKESNGYWIEGEKLYLAPPAAAHGDEAVRISKLLDLADQHAERRLADARSDEAAAAELESSEEDEAGNWYGACIGAADTARASAAIIKSLADEIRSLAAMRVQAGEGGA